MEIRALNVNHALYSGLKLLQTEGREENSRNGKVLRALEPVMTIYTRPWERVLFSALRDANPFFHMFESLWMLGGFNTINHLTPFVARMADFADGEFQWGAYGFRWRHFFDFDQLKEVVHHLRKLPDSRRAVLTMWAPQGDLVAVDAAVDSGPYAKDVPCNTHVYFMRSGHALEMTVCCRSNDVVWGAYGANAVHFAFLHEFVASAVGLNMGRMYQFSNNYHIYKERPDVVRLLEAPAEMLRDDLYRSDAVGYYPLDTGLSWQEVLEACVDFVSNNGKHIPQKKPHTFFARVAYPLCLAHQAYKEVSAKEGLRVLNSFDLTYADKAVDWGEAAARWLERRAAKQEGKE